MNQEVPDGAHVLLITKDGKVILEQKTSDYAFNPRNRNKIGMHGGGIESGETPVETVRRELKEELKLDIPEESILKLNSYTKDTELDGSAATVHVFVVNDIDPTRLPTNFPTHGESSAPVVIDTVENLLNNSNVTRVTRLALLDYQKNMTLIT